MTITTSVVLVDDLTPTRTAVAGFLAGYYGATRRSYATDLRIFSDWCGEATSSWPRVPTAPDWSSTSSTTATTRR